MSIMNAFNQSGFQVIHGLSGMVAAGDVAGIIFATYLPYFMVLGFLILVFSQKGIRKRYYAFAEGVLAVILARGIITPLAHFFVHEQRPFSFYGITPLVHGVGWSFPSGHMAVFFALAMAIWFVNRKWSAWYFILAAAMGVARIYVGVHWPLDIIVGAIVGIVSALLVRWVLRGSRRALKGAE